MHSRLRHLVPVFALALIASGLAPMAGAQLVEPNAAGVAVGHIHFRVSDVALHQGFWESLGGRIVPGGIGGMVEVPGVYLLFASGDPSGPSDGSSMNHVGFLTRSYEDTKTALEAVGAEIAVDNADTGQIIGTLPDGVRVELQACGTPTEFDECPSLEGPIAFHHFHSSTSDGAGLAQWYVEAFGMELGERRGSPSAVVPGGRIDMLGGFGGGRGGGRGGGAATGGGARGQAPGGAQADAGTPGTRGRAIDHIGFEVADMAATVAHLESMGVEMDSAPRTIGNLTIAFVTDPNGTYIELTQGLGQ